ncbi:MAG TPA: M17 family peptidase N-terminal domain-containing protein, partial [Solirubrobacterales bacterium]
MAVDSRPMKVEVKQAGLAESGAELVAVGHFEGAELPAPVAAASGADEAKAGFRKLSLLRPADFPPVLIVGLGERDQIDGERLRVAAAIVAKEAARLEATSLAWGLPDGDDLAAEAEALVTGTILASYRFDRFKSGGEDEDAPRHLEALTLLGPAEAERPAEMARIAAEAQNRARDLQTTPANFATPAFLAERAEEIAAASDAITAEVLGRPELEEKKMGGLLAVSQGGPQEPKLIVLRYSGGGSGQTLGLVGKGVTFDSGGISIKPSQAMHEMRMDMSGAAAVVEAMGAIA